MGAKCFENAQALSEHQMQRELQTALRVQGMAPADRWRWLQDTWGRLQNSAALVVPLAPSGSGAARCYATLDEKNRFDEDREIWQALQMPIHQAHQP